MDELLALCCLCREPVHSSEKHAICDCSRYHDRIAWHISCAERRCEKQGCGAFIKCNACRATLEMKDNSPFVGHGFIVRTLTLAGTWLVRLLLLLIVLCLLGFGTCYAVKLLAVIVGTRETYTLTRAHALPWWPNVDFLRFSAGCTVVSCIFIIAIAILFVVLQWTVWPIVKWICQAFVATAFRKRFVASKTSRPPMRPS